jgi:hypothetical protein
MSCRAPAGTNPGSGAYALWVSLTFRLVNSSKMSQDRAAQPSRSSLVMTNMSRLGRRREGRAEVEVGLDSRRSSHGRCSGDHSMSACRPPRRVRTPPDVHSSICDDADRGCPSSTASARKLVLLRGTAAGSPQPPTASSPSKFGTPPGRGRRSRRPHPVVGRAGCPGRAWLPAPGSLRIRHASAARHGAACRWGTFDCSAFRSIAAILLRIAAASCSIRPSAWIGRRRTSRPTSSAITQDTRLVWSTSKRGRPRLRMSTDQHFASGRR